jgi:dihydrolipoamide dehydrogenase
MATLTPTTSVGTGGSPYDIAVIGAGPGGYVAAIRAAQMGARVLVIEKDDLGGTCLNRGCIPTKAFLSDVKPLRRIKNSPVYEGRERLSLNIQEMVNRKNQLVRTMVDGIATLFKSNGIQWVRGVASFVDSKTVGVTRGGKKETYRANNIIIGTGSRVGTIPDVTIDGRNILSSDEVLDITEIPREMVIIGGGVIGVEFAAIFNGLGTTVTIVEMLPTILSTEDEEIVRALHMILEREGVTVLTDSKVTEVSPRGGKVEVRVQGKSGGNARVVAEKVLVAVGRTPQTEGLGLEAIGLRMDGPFIEVNTRMETSVDGVYAIGDVIGNIMLAHAASAEGIVAVENIMGKSRQIDYRRIPTAIYTFPEIASVGLQENEARKSGLDIRVGKFPYLYNGKAVAMGEPDGFVKIITETELGEVLGVHILGENATDLIGECVLAMNLEASVEDLGEAVRAHPTVSEAITEAALDWNKASIHQPRKK